MKEVQEEAKTGRGILEYRGRAQVGPQPISSLKGREKGVVIKKKQAQQLMSVELNWKKPAHFPAEQANQKKSSLLSRFQILIQAAGHMVRSTRGFW